MFWSSESEYKAHLKLYQENPDRLADFAIVYYNTIFPDVKGTEEWNRLLATVSKLSAGVYDVLTKAEEKEMAKVLCLKGEFKEPSIFEDPTVIGNAHSILNKAKTDGADPSLLELLLIAHDIEHMLRPTLLRLNWLIRRTDGETIHYSRSQLNRSGKQGSIGYGIDQILTKCDLRRKHEILTKAEMKEIKDFVKSLNARKEFPIGAEDFRNWIAHRDFIFSKDEVILNLHPYPGKRAALTKSQITQILEQTVGLVVLCATIDAIFRLISEANLGIMKPVLRPRWRP